MRKIIAIILMVCCLVPSSAVFANEGVKINAETSEKVLSFRTEQERESFVNIINILNDVIDYCEEGSDAQKLYINAFMSICYEFYYNKLDREFNIETVTHVLEKNGLVLFAGIQ